MKIGFDTNTKLTLIKAQGFKKLGLDFVGRYVGRYKMSLEKDIDIIEKNNILKAGLDLYMIQHCPGKPGILPSKDLGVEYGINAREFSKQVEYEKGCVLYLDLEDINPDFKYKQQLIYDYVNFWSEQVYKYYDPGVYIGFNNYMTSVDLYYKFSFIKDYFRSFSIVPEVYLRGYSLIQKYQTKELGILIDKNELNFDKLGRLPKFMKGDIIPESIPVTGYEKIARDILKEELNLDFDYWDQVKYFDALCYKLGLLFNKWSKEIRKI